ncbi:uncharacterized protein LOC129601627 [Paramacrobiotus metropolitanus]|uniref:uncharacterized protein LOC129601627 n=1 Tax=Paramacrobiotus metropolitanus TaxID=2943436 RepID=UPI0024462D9A|nr:uncharacterized protein LOC129601627 [Paramacrobiotus metropolitanus]XP_055356465.1 uncharacterized protein LOC129601627 [Paramacrobiotus metropolitanus]XP_055356466.1 uncharacterized protein LOC129601627 [Paramacrobiotus metropolitanus]
MDGLRETNDSSEWFTSLWYYKPDVTIKPQVRREFCMAYCLNASTNLPDEMRAINRFRLSPRRSILRSRTGSFSSVSTSLTRREPVSCGTAADREENTANTKPLATMTSAPHITGTAGFRHFTKVPMCIGESGWRLLAIFGGEIQLRSSLVLLVIRYELSEANPMMQAVWVNVQKAACFTKTITRNL